MFEKYGINGFIAVAIGVAGLLLFAGNGYIIHRATSDPASSEFGVLALLILLGLAAFLGLISIISLISSWIGVADNKQAFGLPEGSVRAILTIAFIVIVGVLASYLLVNSEHRRIGAGENALVLAMNLPLPDAQAFIASNRSPEGLMGLRPYSAPDDAGMPAAAGPTYDVIFHPQNDTRLKEDVSKQILTMLSTILAAMIGFYFGARPGETDPDAANRGRAMATIERVVAAGAKVDGLIARAQALIDVKFASTDQAANRTKAQEARARLQTLREAIKDADAMRFHAGTTVAQIVNAAASMVAAEKEVDALSVTIGKLET